MTTTTQLSRSIDYTIDCGYFGEFADCYDIDAINGEILDRLNDLLPDGMTVLANGWVLVELPTGRLDDPALDAANGIDFDELLGFIDYDGIVEKHERAHACDDHH